MVLRFESEESGDQNLYENALTTWSKLHFEADETVKMILVMALLIFSSTLLMLDHVTYPTLLVIGQLCHSISNSSIHWPEVVRHHNLSMLAELVDIVTKNLVKYCHCSPCNKFELSVLDSGSQRNAQASVVREHSEDIK